MCSRVLVFVTFCLDYIQFNLILPKNAILKDLSYLKKIKNAVLVNQMGKSQFSKMTMESLHLYDLNYTLV